jgi:hypothetical protein
VKLNVGIGYILGMILIAFCSALYVLHSKEWLTDITPGFWTWAPLIFAMGTTLIATGLMKFANFKFLILVFIVSAVGYWLVQVM